MNLTVYHSNYITVCIYNMDAHTHTHTRDLIPGAPQ